MIEANAIAEACNRVTPPDIATLRGLIAQMHAAVDQDQIEQVLDLDRQFHGFIVHMSGFEFVSSVWRSLTGVLRARTARALEGLEDPAAYLRDNIDYHVRLIDALAAGDARRAQRVAWEHVADVPEELRREIAVTLARGSR